MPMLPPYGNQSIDLLVVCQKVFRRPLRAYMRATLAFNGLTLSPGDVKLLRKPLHNINFLG